MYNMIINIYTDICTNTYLEHFSLNNYTKTYIPIKKDIAEYISQTTTPIEKYGEINVTNINIDSDIPKDIYLVWHSTELPPIMKRYVDDEIKQNPELNFHIYDVDKCKNFIKENFDQSVLNAFDTLNPIAYKVDLWRYCVMYKKGGIYVDIKLMPVNGFKFVNLLDKERFMLERDGSFWENNTFGVSNALIITKPGNQIFLDCIENIVENVNNKFYGFNNLYPTGPGLLGQIYFEYKKKYDDMDLFFVGFIDGKYTIQLEKKIILQSYSEYGTERLMGGQLPYGQVYWDRNIYNENS